MRVFTVEGNRSSGGPWPGPLMAPVAFPECAVDREWDADPSLLIIPMKVY